MLTVHTHSTIHTYRSHRFPTPALPYQLHLHSLTHRSRRRLADYVLNSQNVRELPTISNIVPEADKLTVAETDRGDGKKRCKIK